MEREGKRAREETHARLSGVTAMKNVPLNTPPGSSRGIRARSLIEEKPNPGKSGKAMVRARFHQRQLKEPQEVPPCGAPCLTREPSGSGEITVGHGQ